MDNPGQWFFGDTLLVLKNKVGLLKAHSRLVYVKGFSRTIIPDSGTEELPVPVTALKPRNDGTICRGAAVYVQGADEVKSLKIAMSRLHAMVSDPIEIRPVLFSKVDSCDDPVMLDVLVSVSSHEEVELGAAEVEMLIATQAHPFRWLFALDDHLQEICFKSDPSVKGFHGIAKKGWTSHADRELGEVVHALRELLWEHRSNTRSNHPKSLVTYIELKRAEEIWAAEKLKMARIITSIMQVFTKFKSP